MCLVFDIEEHVERRIPCCSRTNIHYPNGQNQCIDQEAARSRCPMYRQSDSRRTATEAVRDMLGGEYKLINNIIPYYYLNRFIYSTVAIFMINFHRHQDQFRARIMRLFTLHLPRHGERQQLLVRITCLPW